MCVLVRLLRLHAHLSTGPHSTQSAGRVWVCDRVLLQSKSNDVSCESSRLPVRLLTHSLAHIATTHHVFCVYVFTQVSHRAVNGPVSSATSEYLAMWRQVWLLVVLFTTYSSNLSRQQQQHCSATSERACQSRIQAVFCISLLFIQVYLTNGLRGFYAGIVTEYAKVRVCLL